MASRIFHRNYNLAGKTRYTVLYSSFIKPGACQPAGFLKLVWYIQTSVGAHVCMCVCVSAPRLLITSGVIWTLCDWLNKYFSRYTI